MAWVGLKRGFLSMWAVTFNLTVSVYLAVMLLPAVAAVLPNSGTESWFYSCSACMLLIAALTFGVLQPIASAYFSGGYAVTFPKLLNTVVAAGLGFVSGYVTTAFVLLAISLMPFTAHRYVSQTLDERNLAPAIRGAVTASCNVIGAASVQIYPRRAIDVLNEFSSRRARFIASQTVSAGLPAGTIKPSCLRLALPRQRCCKAAS